MVELHLWFLEMVILLLVHQVVLKILLHHQNPKYLMVQVMFHDLHQHHQQKK
jgi:hypothetical protein